MIGIIGLIGLVVVMVAFLMSSFLHFKLDQVYTTLRRTPLVWTNVTKTMKYINDNIFIARVAMIMGWVVFFSAVFLTK